MQDLQSIITACQSKQIPTELFEMLNSLHLYISTSDKLNSLNQNKVHPPPATLANIQANANREKLLNDNDNKSNGKETVNDNNDISNIDDQNKLMVGSGCDDIIKQNDIQLNENKHDDKLNEIVKIQNEVFIDNKQFKAFFTHHKKPQLLKEWCAAHQCFVDRLMSVMALLVSGHDGMAATECKLLDNDYLTILTDYNTHVSRCIDNEKSTLQFPTDYYNPEYNISKKICQCLSRYYKQCDQPYDNLFSTWCERYLMCDEILMMHLNNIDTDYGIFASSDDNFPIPLSRVNDSKKYIFEIICKCYNNPNITFAAKDSEDEKTFPMATNESNSENLGQGKLINGMCLCIKCVCII